MDLWSVLEGTESTVRVCAMYSLLGIHCVADVVRHQIEMI